MKKRLILLVVISVPALLYLNVWQAFRYRTVETEIRLLEAKQLESIEGNKKVIIGVEVLGAPSRIDGLASEMNDLYRPRRPAAIRIEIVDSKGGGDG